MEENKDLQTEEENAQPEEVSREDQIFMRLHEIDIIVEEYEDKVFNQEIDPSELDEVKKLKQEYKELKAELRQIKKTQKKGGWEKIPFWLAFYGIAVVVLGMYPIVPMLPLDIVSLIYPLLPSAIQTEFVFYLIIILYSVVLLLITFIVWLYYAKDKDVKRNILILLGIQFVVAIVANLFSFL